MARERLKDLPNTLLAGVELQHTISVPMATIATTGTGQVNVTSPVTGRLRRASFVGTTALAANDTNYVTFAIVNKGQAGAGSTAMLAATDANTSKATGGSAIGAFTTRTLTLSTTEANLSVTKGDTLNVTVAATGTLAGTITFPTVTLEFGE